MKHNRVFAGPPEMLEPCPPDPLDFALCQATWLLGGLGYQRATIATVIEHCREQGSAFGCEALADVHVSAVESLLPMSRDWKSPMWEAERFAVSGPYQEGGNS